METSTTTRKLILTCGLVFATLLNVACSDSTPDGKALYNDFCATSCHGINNEGTFGSTTSAPSIKDASTTGIRRAIDDEPFMRDRSDLKSLRSAEIRAISLYIPSP